MAWYAIVGPREAGATERDQMFARASAILESEGVEDPQRVDVPAKGTAAATEGTALREAVHAIVPALQSGSLFGGKTGVVIVDTQQLLKAEVDAITEMLKNADEDQAVAVFLAAGTLPAAIKKLVATSGKVTSVKTATERDAALWITDYAKSNGLRIDQAARSALIQTFGSNTSQMKNALEQIAVGSSTVTADDIEDRFTNRPDEPLWFLGDAIMAGDQGQALRRLGDFLHHQHPLIFLSYLEGEVRKRSLASVAPDYDTFTTWAKANPNSYATKKIWEARTRANAGALSQAVGAISRADLTLKTMPEATHRVTLERLTVAMCRWMSR
ncbi:MAG: DNA polymerase III subunit delta [Actinomycetia bacterium]|nr:DNA polymerase III subunit delta [Actinomycetes bacterium]